jgi:hypothetical protein
MRYIRALFLTAISSIAALAQFESATVLGTIRDATGSVVTNAKVRLNSVATGISVEQPTDSGGNFEFFSVRVGRYTLSAEAAGFSTATTEEFSVSPGARQRVDLQLAIGQVAETIQVTDAVKLLETDSSQRAQSVGQKAIVELPLNGRQYSQLALLTTGVRSSALSTGGATPREGSFNVNGLRSTFNNFLLDGIDNNAYGTSNQGFSNQVMQPPPEALTEFQVVTNNYSAEYGRSGGAAINVAYRSGGNGIHGNAWWFLRNTALNATGFFKPVDGVKPQFNRNQFGATIGGPIRKNRAFFFLDYEGFRQRRGAVSFNTIPTLNDRQGIFSVPVRNPLTGAVYAANTPIPQSDITPFARKVLSDLPQPTNAGTAQNFVQSIGFRDNTDKYNAKIDYLINDQWNGFTRVGQRKANIFDEPNIPGPSGGDGNGYTDVINQQAVTAMNWVPGPANLLEFRFGFSRTIAGKAPPGLGFPTMDVVYGISGLPTDPRVAGGLTSQLINGYTNLGRQATNPQWQYPTMWNPKVNYSTFRGKHSVRLGYEYQRVHTEIQDVNPLYGEDRYAGQFSRPVGVTAGSNTYNMADFLFGARDRFRLTNLLIAQYRQALHFLYLQDDWKVTSKLTLNLGVRYEYGTPQWEATNQLTNFNPVFLRMDQAIFGSLPDRALIVPDRNNVAPRVGLAYQATNSTVIRAGGGTSYVHFHRSGGGNILAINGPQVINAVVNQSPAVAGFRPTQDGYPAGLTSPAQFNPLAANITYMPRDTRTSYVNSWFFSIQQQLAKDFLVDVAYVGNRASKLLLFADFNQAIPNLPGQNIALQQRRPIQSFSDITYAFNGAWSNYHSMQVRLEKRYSNGFFFLNSFTWSKAMDNGAGALEGPNGNASAPQDFYNLAAEKGPSAYDQPITNVTSVLYQVPVGRGRKVGADMNRFLDAVVGGWNVSGIGNYWTGATINMFHNLAGAYQVSSIGPDWRGAPRFRPNVSGDPVLENWREQPLPTYLNSANVSLPTNNVPFGNAGRNIARMPNFFGIDLAVTKDFPLWSEASSLQFRAEAFNILNRTNFQAIEANRNSPAFGRFLTTFDPRLIQFALRLTY